MARTKHTTNDSRGSRKGLKAPRKTVIAKKVIARKSASAPKPHTRRSKQGVVAQREIKRQQKLVTCALPKLPFSKLVRAICQGHGQDYRFQANALEALQNAVEKLLVDMLSDSQLLSLHANRITIMDRDIKILMQVTRPGFLVGVHQAQK